VLDEIRARLLEQVEETEWWDRAAHDAPDWR